LSDEGLKTLGQGLQRLGSLECIYLDFAFGNITDRGLKNLREGLARLKFVRSLEIDFSLCDNITDNCLKYFGKNEVAGICDF